MKLQESSRKEIRRISVGTAVCDVIMVAGLFLLSQFDIGTFSLKKILLSSLIGSAVAIANFTVMCLTVQSAVNMTDKKKMQAKFQLSYNVRNVIQAAWTVAAFLLEPIHFVAGAAPILFPKVTILYLQARGKLLPPDPPRTPSGVSEESVEPEAPESSEN